jgi:hypothetical protein
MIFFSRLCAVGFSKVLAQISQREVWQKTSLASEQLFESSEF